MLQYQGEIPRPKATPRMLRSMRCKATLCQEYRYAYAPQLIYILRITLDILDGLYYRDRSFG